MREKNLLTAILKEEININTSSVNEYLNKNGINIVGQYFSYNKNLDSKNIFSQINLIVNFHKTLIGCRFDGLSRIGSTIGKEIESYKVQIRRLQRDYDYILNNCCQNNVDRLILLEGNNMIKQGTESIDYIYKHDYFSAIERSMNRQEICIGRVDAGNLRKNKEKFEIGTIKNMTYNLVEEDMYKYIKKLQRRGIDIDEEELINIFVHSSHLSFNSLEYLRGLCSYPRDFFRGWERYRQNKKGKTNDEFLTELKNSLNYEGKSFFK